MSYSSKTVTALKVNQDPKAQRRLADYLRQKALHVFLNIVGYCVILAAGTFLFIYLAGDYFGGVLNRFGLKGISNMMSGIYTDCSKWENRNKEICQPPKSQADRHWSNVKYRGAKGGAVFSIE